MEDRGIYVCRAENVAGRAQASAIIEVASKFTFILDVFWLGLNFQSYTLAVLEKVLLLFICIGSNPKSLFLQFA